MACATLIGVQDRVMPADGDGRPRHRRRKSSVRINLAALLSLISGVAGWVVIFTLRFAFRDAYWLLTFPLLGVIALALGIVGLVRARKLGAGKRQAIAGLVAGAILVLFSVGVLFLVWKFSRDQGNF